MLRSIQDTIDIAKISTYLSGNDNASGALWGARLNPNLQRLIYIEMKSLEWAYEQSGTYPNIDFIANYVYALCGRYGIKAQAILDGGGGGSVVPVSPVTAPNPIEFVVSSSSYIPIGADTKTITSFIGYNLLFVRNNVTQSTVDVGSGSSFYTWSRTTGVLTISPAALDTELFQLIPYL